jgi:hypothetical protein
MIPSGKVAHGVHGHADEIWRNGNASVNRFSISRVIYWLT